MYLCITHTNRLSRSVMAAVVNHSFQIAQSFQNPGWIRLPDASLLRKSIPKQRRLFWTPQVNLWDASVAGAISPPYVLWRVSLTQTISLIKLADLSSICGVRAGSRCLEA